MQMKRNNFIDELIHQKRAIPGPSNYTPLEQQRPLSGKMDKGPRKTVTEAIIDRNRREGSPGPTSYFTRPMTAASPPHRPPPTSKDHYLNEVEYLATEGPGVGQYNVEYFKRDHVQSPKIGGMRKIEKR
ncbi:unnamed protein product [Sphagnum balticum]